MWPWVIANGTPLLESSIVYDGSYAVDLGDGWFSNNALGQMTTEPTWAESGALYFAWQLDTIGFPNLAEDRLIAGVVDAQQNVIASGYMDALAVPSQETWYVARLPVSNVIGERGNTLTVVISDVNQTGTWTDWYVDDVALVFGCGATIAGAEPFTSTHRVNLTPLTDPSALATWARKLRSGAKPLAQ